MKMIISLSDAWKIFEKYAMEKGYTTKILGAYTLCNEQGKRIKLMSIRMSEQKLVIWEDSLYHTMDME
jgi:hypothetical protein